MQSPEEGMLLRIFVGETDQYKGKALYGQVVTRVVKYRHKPFDVLQSRSII